MVKEKEEAKTWVVVAKPTAHEPVIYNTKTKEEYDLFAAIVKILNTLEED